jgi:hypothetical protein
VRLSVVRVTAVRLPFAALLCAAVLAGCSDDDEAPADAAPGAREGPSGRDRPGGRERPPAGERRASRLVAPPCPPAIAGCRRAAGRIAYVERVDPDGDGDAHFVLISREGITAPGISVIDVKRSLRPRPLPGVGDRLAASGPVFEGSYGQRQIEAVALRVARQP